MKKTLIVFVGVLVAIFIVLTAIDSSDYKLEKKVWRLQQKYKTLTPDPEMVPDQEFDSLIANYRSLIDGYGHSELAPRIYIQISRVYFLKKDYVNARTSLEQAMKKFGDEPSVVAEFLANIGKCYEAEKKSEEALSIYRSIIKDYPMTPQGLNLPLYMAEYYNRLDRPQDSAKQLRMAAEFYRQMAKQQPNSRLEFDSLKFLSTAYMAQKQWQPAVNALKDILMNYAHPSYIDQKSLFMLIRSINVLCLQRLGDYDQPKKIFRQFIVTHPDHILNNTLEGVIKGVEAMEESKKSSAKEE